MIRINWSYPLLRHSHSPSQPPSSRSHNAIARLGESGSSGSFPARRKKAELSAAKSPPSPPSPPGPRDKRADFSSRVLEQSINGLGDVVDCAAQVPCPAAERHVGEHTNAQLSPNALGLNNEALGASLDRTALNLSAQQAMGGDKVALSLARNLGSTVFGGRVDIPDGSGHHLKLGMSTSANRDSLGLGPSLGLDDRAKDEAGLGSGVFSTATQELEVTNYRSADRVDMQSRRVFGIGGALDPRGALQHLYQSPVGAFIRFVRNESRSEIFRFQIGEAAARSLMQRVTPRGPTAHIVGFVRRWLSAVDTKSRPVHIPELMDPFGDELGGRALMPGQELVVQKSGTLTWGGGAGAMGLRAGYYRSTNTAWEYHIVGLPQRQLRVIAIPRSSQATTQSVDAPATPAWQSIQSEAVAWRWEGTFDCNSPADREAYRRLIADGIMPLEMELTTAGRLDPQQICKLVRGQQNLPPSSLAQAITRAEHTIVGITRLPFASETNGWGGLGQHSVKTLVDQVVSDGELVLQFRVTTREDAVHRLFRGISKTRWSIALQQTRASQERCVSVRDSPARPAIGPATRVTQRAA